MIVIGLTGSIGMGKSTTAKMFADAGIAVNDSDRVVHELYRGEAVEPIEAAFPGTVHNGEVDRSELSRKLARNPANFKLLESIIHPLVLERELEFLKAQRESAADMVVLDIPLLYETGAEKRVDVVVAVSCDSEIQRKRVLDRPGMTPEKFAMILERQMPDAEKRRRADFVIDTGHGLEAARKQVLDIIERLRRWAKAEA